MIGIEFKLILALFLMPDITERLSAFLDKVRGQTEEITKPKTTLSPPPVTP